MNLNLKQPEIELAIRSHLEKQGLALPISHIEFTKGRGLNSLTAEVTINLNGSNSAIKAQEDSAPVRSAPFVVTARNDAPAAVTEPSPAPEAVEEPVAEVSESEAETDDDDSVTGEAETAAEAAVEAKPRKSLFA